MGRVTSEFTEFTPGELDALRRFADHWLHHPGKDTAPQTASEWRAIHKIRNPDYDPDLLIPEGDDVSNS